MAKIRPLTRLGLMGLALIAAAPSLGAPGCVAQSSSTVTPVVELYTSEGCSSCPPADQWLSGLKTPQTIVALAFHVDYWDRLGWKDRFASPAHTQRQAQQVRSSGARFSYTPQVLIDGTDRPDWPRASISASGRATAPVTVNVAREGPGFIAEVTPMKNAPARLAAYWAVTEQGHVSTVKAGENRGSTLMHDHVVREYLPVAAWAPSANGSATTLRFDPAAAADPAHAREVNLVIVNADTGKPVQAVKLGC